MAMCPKSNVFDCTSDHAYASVCVHVLVYDICTYVCVCGGGGGGGGVGADGCACTCVCVCYVCIYILSGTACQTRVCPFIPSS